ncbi:hypothetical protein MIR68_007378 [Amoeboaphelidium protococcarum]|nr:hypothetical protein MIR68_007378 [Amoeboaphelidium protococcarum]
MYIDNLTSFLVSKQQLAVGSIMDIVHQLISGLVNVVNTMTNQKDSLSGAERAPVSETSDYTADAPQRKSTSNKVEESETHNGGSSALKQRGRVVSSSNNKSKKMTSASKVGRTSGRVQKVKNINTVAALTRKNTQVNSQYNKVILRTVRPQRRRSTLNSQSQLLSQQQNLLKSQSQAVHVQDQILVEDGDNDDDQMMQDAKVHELPTTAELLEREARIKFAHKPMVKPFFKNRPSNLLSINSDISALERIKNAKPVLKSDPVEMQIPRPISPTKYELIVIEREQPID